MFAEAVRESSREFEPSAKAISNSTGRLGPGGRHE